MQIETNVATSILLLVLASKDVLKEKGIVFALECSLAYTSTNVALVHDPTLMPDFLSASGTSTPHSN